MSDYEWPRDPPRAEPTAADVERVARYLRDAGTVRLHAVLTKSLVDEWRDVARAAMAAGLDPSRVP